MGRGRKGLINQSERKPIPSRGNRYRGLQSYFLTLNKKKKKISVPEHVVDFMNNMNPQQLVDFLLPNGDDWHVKTSSGNASGN